MNRVAEGALQRVASTEGPRPENEAPHPAEAASEQEPPQAHLVVRRLGEFDPEPLRPMFGGRLLQGKIAAIAGNAGIGKSYLTAVLATHVSRGWPLPGDDSPTGPADVLIASYEDDPGDTLRPRLDALGADVNRVHVIEGAYDGESSTVQPFGTDHIPHLSQQLNGLPEAKLLIIDPVSAWVGDIDEHRNNEVRNAVEGLRNLVASRDLAAVIVTHLRKAGADNALHRISGSGAYGQLVRSVVLAATDPDSDDESCALAHIKHNLTGRAPTLGYRVDANGFHWLGERDDIDGERLVGHDRDDERSARSEAEEFLLGELDNGARPAKEIQAEARQVGIAEQTLKRAKRKLGVRSDKDGMEGGWRWSLPEGGQKGAKGTEWTPSDPFGADVDPFGDASGESPCPRCGQPRFTAGPPDTLCADCYTREEAMQPL